MKISVCVVAAVVSSGFLINAEPTFEDLATELVSLESSQGDFNEFVKLVKPAANFAGMSNLIKDLTTLDPSKFFDSLQIITNAVTGYHDAVDKMGGLQVYKNKSDTMAMVFLNGFIGHLNSQNEVSPNVMKVTVSLQKILNSLEDIFYTDVYNIVVKDVADLNNGILAIVDPARSLVSAIIDLINEIKSWYSGDRRRLMEQLEVLIVDIHRDLSVIDTVEGVFCKIAPILQKVISALEIVSSNEFRGYLDSFIAFIDNYKSLTNVIETIENVITEVKAFLEKWDPLIHDVILSVISVAVDYFAKSCPSGERLLVEASFGTSAPLNTSTGFKVLDFLVDVLATAQRIVDMVPQPLTHTLIDAAATLIRSLVESQTGTHISNILHDIDNALLNLADFIHAAANLIPVLQHSIEDGQQLFADAKFVVQESIHFGKLVSGEI